MGTLVIPRGRPGFPPYPSGVGKFGKQRVDVSLVANYALVGARALGMRSERVWIVSDGVDDALNT